MSHNIEVTEKFSARDYLFLNELKVISTLSEAIFRFFAK